MGSSSSNECTPENNYNVTLPRVVQYFLYDDTERIIITIINPIILAFGLLGNIAFLFVMVRIPRMRTVTNIYLINLAIADITFLSLAVLDKLGRFIVSPIASDQYPIGQPGCRSIYTISNTAYFASIYLITMVSLEKYYAICKPIQHRLFGSKKRSYRFIIRGWIISFAFACALLPGYYYLQITCISWPRSGGDYDHLPNIVGLCVAMGDWAIPYLHALQAGPFLIAMILNTAMYVMIILKIRQQTQTRPGNGGNNISHNLNRAKIRNQVTKMLVINGVIFFVTQAPFQLSCLATVVTDSIDTYLLNTDQFNTLFHVCRMLAYINSAVNPYIYTIFNARYRQSFKEAFLGPCTNKSRRVFVTDSVMDDKSTVETSATADSKT